MVEMRSILVIIIWIIVPLVVSGEKDVKLAAGTLQEEAKEKINNNIPVDPGGGKPIKEIPEDIHVPVETVSEQNKIERHEHDEINGQESLTKHGEDISEENSQVGPIKLQSDLATGDVLDSLETLQEELLDNTVTEGHQNVKEGNGEVPDNIRDASNTTSDAQLHPGGDKSEQPENEAKMEEDKSASSDIQPGQTILVEPKQEKQGEEIQTFTEWTQKVLEEEAQKSASETLGSSVSKSKRTTNYASKECGAKVLASNPEAEHVKAVLTGNKDEYMINPCKVAKKWFVIELCEPIHVSHFEVASFELFSSQPKTFRIHLSDRYPTKEWTNLGEFTATEERVSQTFQIKQGYVVQFVKVEMLDHYGTEHFCPLTWFRLFGVSVEYDEYGHQPHVDNDDNDNDMDDVLMRNGDITEDTNIHKNLFASATDTVMKLVKKVLNVEDKTQKTEKNKTVSVGDTFAVDNPNATQTNMTADGIMLPCVPKKTDKDGKLGGIIQPQPPLPQSGVGTSAIDNKDKKTEKDDSIVTKLEDYEQIPSVSDNLVTLIPGDNDDDDIPSCDLITDTLSEFSYFRRPVCKYLELMKYMDKLPMCSLHEFQEKEHDITANGKSASKENGKADQQEISVEKSNVPTTSKTIPQVSEKVVESKQEVTDLSSEEMISASSTAIIQVASSYQAPQMSTKTIESVVMDKTTISVAPIDPSTSSSQMDATKSFSDIKPHVENSSSSESSSQDVSKTIQPSSSVDELAVKSSEVTPSLGDIHADVNVQQSTVNFILVDKTPSEKQMEQTIESKPQPEVPVVDEGNKIEASSTTEFQSTPVDEIKVSETDGPSTEVVEPIVVGDNIPAVQNGRDLGLVRVPILPYQKRETAIMRLNNRIKALEMNVSLSSRFLEEMSRKFKKQTEDMIKQHVFNNTIGEITNITKAVEKQSLIQKQKIDILETKVQNLTEVVLRLTENMENLNQQVQDKEFKYIVTLLIFCVIALFIMKKKSIKAPPELQQTGPLSDLTHVKRRNSFSGCDNDRIQTLGPRIQKYNSETTLVNRRFSPEIDPGGVSSYQVKKKKKKKHKISDSSTYLPSKEKITHQKTEINSAGLLFGTSTRDSSPEDKEKKNIKRAHSYGGILGLFASDKQEQFKPKGPDKKDPVVNYSKSNGCMAKKPTRSVVTGSICQPMKMSNGCTQDTKSGSSNGVTNGHHDHNDDEVDDDYYLIDSAKPNDIMIVSPFKKGFSFTKGASQNIYKDPLLKSQTGKHGRHGHSRAGSLDMGCKSVSFKEINGHK